MTKRDQERMKHYSWAIKEIAGKWVAWQILGATQKIITPYLDTPSQVAAALKVYLKEVHRA